LDGFAIGKAAGFEEFVDNGINPVLIYLAWGRPGQKDQLGFVFLGIVLFAHGFCFSLHHEGDFCSRLIDLAHQRKRLVSSKPPCVPPPVGAGSALGLNRTRDALVDLP